MKKIKNNEAPIVTGLSEENIQRLEDIGFDWNPLASGTYSAKKRADLFPRVNEKYYNSFIPHFTREWNCLNKSVAIKSKISF